MASLLTSLENSDSSFKTCLKHHFHAFVVDAVDDDDTDDDDGGGGDRTGVVLKFKP